MLKVDEIADKKSCFYRALPYERMFVLLARAEAAPIAIKAWIDERIRLGKNTEGDEQITEAYDCLESMRREREDILAKLQEVNKMGPDELRFSTDEEISADCPPRLDTFERGEKRGFG